MLLSKVDGACFALWCERRVAENDAAALPELFIRATFCNDFCMLASLVWMQSNYRYKSILSMNRRRLKDNSLGCAMSSSLRDGNRMHNGSVRYKTGIHLALSTTTEKLIKG